MLNGTNYSAFNTFILEKPGLLCGIFKILEISCTDKHVFLNFRIQLQAHDA